MRKVALAVVDFLALLACSSVACGQVATLDPKRVDEIARDLRRQFVNEPKGSVASEEERLTVRALIAIVDEESGPSGDQLVRGRALTQLGMYPRVTEGIGKLIEEIDNSGSIAKLDNWPLAKYRAAQALIHIGVPARRQIMGALVEPIPEHKLHLMAYVLAELDQDDELGLDVKSTVFRLQREIEQTREFPFGNEERRSTKIRNLERMIDMLREHNFAVKRIPPKPKESVGAKKPSSLIEEALKQERKTTEP